MQDFLVTISVISGDTEHQVTLETVSQHRCSRKKNTKPGHQEATFSVPAVSIS
ncbi:hypothetical protein I79_024068 [Cricetulus griseus]|uniref:Uncharacterized protein n=1 Tax=Cricetulus griseus TaxID=10029 RepID=G3IJN2_CRIGR|nr:hypothetical protein I79_024068 [Cricetulus griseus]